MTHPRRSQRLQAKPEATTRQQPFLRRKRTDRDERSIQPSDWSEPQPQPQPQPKRHKKDGHLGQITAQPVPKRYPLSEKNLRRHQRTQERQISQPSMGKSRKISSNCSGTTTTTTSEKPFARKLTENRILYEPFDTEPPDDAQKLTEALLQDQDVPTWAHRNWENIKVLKREGAQNELSLESMIVESMLTQHGNSAPLGYNRFRNQQWTEVENEVTAGISDPKPDVTETYVWSAYHKDTKEEFEELIISQYAHAMPTFAMESKGAFADPEQAVRQAAYDGAVMTHAAINLDSRVGKKTARFRKTKAITITLSTSEINIFANHAVEKQPESGVIYYHQYLLLTVRYIVSEERWNKAHNVLFNAQKLALDLANTRIDDLRKYFEHKAVKLEELKLEQANLEREAQGKIQGRSASVVKKTPHVRDAESEPSPQDRVVQASSANSHCNQKRSQKRTQRKPLNTT